MKKHILITVLSIIGMLIISAPTLALTTASLTPASINVNPGQSFNVSISIDPQGTSNFVEKVELKYPADILQVNSFTLSSQWMALTQSGYDLIDNVNGFLIKSAGYPNGFSSATTFGTVSFSAKKAGTGIISIGSSSIAFESSNQNTISGLPISVTITVPETTSSKPETITPTALETSQEPTPISSTDEQFTGESVNEPTTEQTASVNAPFVGAMSSIITLGTGSTLVAILVLVLIAMVWFYMIRPRIKKKEK
jgi:hypothetical protein